MAERRPGRVRPHFAVIAAWLDSPCGFLRGDGILARGNLATVVGDVRFHRFDEFWPQACRRPEILERHDPDRPVV